MVTCLTAWNVGNFKSGPYILQSAFSSGDIYTKRT